jgi:energy-coupling factor transport system permease protein
MIGIALRFIPILLQEMSTIAAAQRARGADMRKLKNVAALMVPLFSSSLARAEDLALAMDSRGYQSGAKRSKLREASWRVRDSLALV